MVYVGNSFWYCSFIGCVCYFCYLYVNGGKSSKENYRNIRIWNLQSTLKSHIDYFGLKDKSDKRLLDVKELFEKAKIDYEIPEDIEYSIWLKYLMNVSTNQPSAVYNMTFGEMRNSKEIRELIKNLMDEVQKIAKAEGVKNTERMYEDAKNALRTMMSEGKTSMLQDVLAKRKTEVDIFAGTIIELGKKHGIQVPYNELMREKIEAIHQSYS